jgi:hypothetical protein
MEMRDFAEPKPPTPKNTKPIMITVLIATILGASLGIVIANQDEMSILNRKTARLIAGISAFLPRPAIPEMHRAKIPMARQSDMQPAQRVISAGISSIGAISYSAQLDSSQIAFELKDAVLVRTEKLSSPDRIYFDLQDKHQESRMLGQLKEQKEVEIDGRLVSKVRISNWDSGATRIVLDLMRSCDFTYQTPADSPSRLIVRLQPVASRPPTPQLAS